MRYMKSAQFTVLEILFIVFILIGLPTVILGADTYPSKPVRLIVPSATGGGQDILGRLIAAKLSERLGKQVVVENHPGGGGIIGMEMVSKSAPDGYTLMIINATSTIQPALQKLPYDPIKSFTLIVRFENGPLVLLVHPSVPAHSVKEFIALAKQKPGQLIMVGAGVGAFIHSTTELFKIMADIDVKIVQFKSMGPGLVDLLGGHSDATFVSITAALPHIKSGKVRALGTTGRKRSFYLPDVPTIREAGVPGYETTNWIGISAPAGIPAPILERLSKELEVILTSDETKKMFLDHGTEVDYLGPTEFATFYKKELAQWAEVMQKANIKLEN
jgi:tripartite-type tricarboxylate transporter receptor subunit TctC